MSKESTKQSLPMHFLCPDETTQDLHSCFAHPAYEYYTTIGPRGGWLEECVPPPGEGWVRNWYAGSNGWARFRKHEEAYWLRLKPQEFTDSSTHEQTGNYYPIAACATLEQLVGDTSNCNNASKMVSTQIVKYTFTHPCG